MKISRLFHLSHRWTKWETVGEGWVVDKWDSKLGIFVRQQRTCEICGKLQLRKIEST